MGLAPIEMSQIYSRTQDVSSMKQNEEHKPMMDQQNFHNQFQKQVDNQSRTVVDPNKAANNKYDYDAKKKGNNQYEGSQEKRKKKTLQGKKKPLPSADKGFDIRI